MNRHLTIPLARALLLPLALLMAAAMARIALGAPAPVPGPAPTYGKEATEKLEREGWSMDRIHLEGAEEPGVRRVHADGRVRIPAEQVWRILTEESRAQRETWPGIKESIFEEERGDTIIRRYLIGIPVFKDRRYRLATVADPSHMRVSFSLVPGYGNVHEIEGVWQLMALGDSLTRVTYDLETDPGVRLVPGFIVNWATKSAIPRLFAHIFERGSQLPANGGMGMRAR